MYQGSERRVGVVGPHRVLPRAAQLARHFDGGGAQAVLRRTEACVHGVIVML